MKRSVCLLSFILTAVLLAGCAGYARIKHAGQTGQASESTPIHENPFQIGEKLTYLITWNRLPVGTATTTVEKIMPFLDYEVYVVRVLAKSNDFLSRLFRIEDTFISYIDRKKLTSRHFEAIIKEGQYRKHLLVDYDFDKGIAFYHNLTDGSVKTCPIEKEVHDSVSAVYFARTIPLKPGGNIELTVNVSEENYRVYANIEKKVSLTLPEMGGFEAFLIKPYMMLDGKRQKRAKTSGYVSADEKRIPLLIIMRVLEIPWIGGVTATLRKIEKVAPAQD